ncbi:hypothetical protein [Gymnodinialimonas hymeniacidonis]|uniref:hypothetical protein n=1 Tax=Gymnodinialimonas hymeniacidonis TaxID=3126508 RepID=UPI0034C60838
MKLEEIQREWQVFGKEGAVGIGAVRETASDHITIYIEGFGEQRITAEQIKSVHDGKVVLNLAEIPKDVQSAIAHAHDAEDRIPRDHPPLP